MSKATLIKTLIEADVRTPIPHPLYTTRVLLHIGEELSRQLKTSTILHSLGRCNGVDKHVKERFARTTLLGHRGERIRLSRSVLYGLAAECTVVSQPSHRICQILGSRTLWAYPPAGQIGETSNSTPGDYFNPKALSATCSTCRLLASWPSISPRVSPVSLPSEVRL